MGDPAILNTLNSQSSKIFKTLNDLVGRPASRDVNSSQRSFLISDLKRYSKLERIPRIITKFIQENWIWLRLLLIGGAVVLGVLVIGPAILALLV
jgi:hypothetical protein